MMDPVGHYLEIHRQTLALRQQRQELLATNIANADTPQYKGRDIDFAAALRQAIGGGPGVRRLPDTHLTQTSSRHLPGSAHSRATAPEQYRIPQQPSLDGNTVEMNVERVQFADNTLHYQTELQVLDTRIRSLLAALQ